MSQPVRQESADDGAVEKFLMQIRQGDAAARLAAVQEADRMGKAAVGPLGQIMSSEDPGAVKAAGEALKRIVHYSARPGADAERKVVASELVKLIAKDQSRATRVQALRMLGFVGGDSEASTIAGQLSDPDVAEEARMALESIPGRAAEAALRKALRSAPQASRPGIQQALQHRRAKWRDIGATPSLQSRR